MSTTAEQEPSLADCRERLAVVRTAVLKCWPFLAAAVIRLAPRWDERVPTAAVDQYWRLYLNPKFFMGLTVGQAAVLLAGHEVQHLLLDHPNRCREHRGKYLVNDKGDRVCLVNVANDLAINSSLKQWADAGKNYLEAQRASRTVPLDTPPGACYPENFKDKNGTPFPSGLISEQYAELLSNLPPSPCGGGGKSGTAHTAKCGSGAGGDKGEWEDPSDPNPGDPSTGTDQRTQEVVRQQVAKALVEQEEKSRGSTPAGLQSWAKVRLSPPKVDWRRELRAMVRSGVNWLLGSADYTYTRRNRRQSGEVVLPGMHRPEPRLIVVQDCSGSMGSAGSIDYERSFSEIAGILKACGMPKVPVVPADAAAYEVQWVKRIEDIKVVGGGGTDMDIGIRAAVALCKPKLIIVLTDGQTSWGIQQSEVHGARVIVVLTSQGAPQPPDWMRVVRAYGA